jgi:carbon-monoxide dehydrogenase large subunit
MRAGERARAANALIGSPIERLEDFRFLRGRGQFIDDVHCDGLLHAAILRSALPHGRIRSIDTAAARARPGVHAVITAADLGGAVPTVPLRQDAMPSFTRFEQPVIANAKVRYVGEPIAVVLADTPGRAEDALEAIGLDIKPLAPVTGTGTSDVLLFEDTGSNLVGTLTGLRGDPDAVFQTADYVRRERFSTQRHSAIPMEPRGLLARWDDDNTRLTLFGAAKVAFVNRRVLARHFDLPEASIRLVENDVGGGFGVRGEFYPEDFLIPFAARLSGRPVKWIEDRREHLTATNHAREAQCELEVACARDGTILALRGHAMIDMGAYLRTNGPTSARNVAQVLSGPYRIPHIRIDVSLHMTSKTPVGTYRGPGRFESDFFRERLWDIAAAELGIDRVEFRRRNLLAESDMPFALAKVVPLEIESETDSGDYRVTLDRCLKEIGWADKFALQGKLVDGRYHGLGIGCYFEGGASGPGEGARLVLETDGSVSVYVGSSAIGQGLETVCAQIAADALELPLASIRGVFHGSTDYVRQGFGSYSSRSVVMGGSAILAAAETLREAIRNAAARRLGCAAGDIVIADGHAIGPGKASIAFGELAQDGIAADGDFRSGKRTYSYGAHAAHVAVDPRTGHVQLIDYVAVEDVGRIINPLTLHGQAVGAIVQGLGGALMEHLVYDDDGQLLTGSLADYVMPTASDFPVVRAVALEEKPAPHNPLGAKGAGEGGIIPVGGVIANAVANALRAFAVQPNALPLSPPRVWQMIEEARRA